MRLCSSVLGCILISLLCLSLPASELNPRVQRVLERYHNEAQRVDEALATARQEAAAAVQQAEEVAVQAHARARSDAANALKRLVHARMSPAEQASIYREILQLDRNDRDARAYFSALASLDQVLAELAEVETDFLGQPISATRLPATSPARQQGLQLAPQLGGALGMQASGNGVQTGPQGLLFDGSGRVFSSASDASRAVQQQIIESGTFSVVIQLSVSELRQAGPARIFSISRSPTERNLSIGQVPGGGLDIRVRSSNTNPNGMNPHMRQRQVLSLGGPQVIVVTRDSEGMHRLYHNGSELASLAVGGDLSNWDPSMEVMLGNEADNSRGWAGIIHSLHLFDRCLSPEEIAALR